MKSTTGKMMNMENNSKPPYWEVNNVYPSLHSKEFYTDKLLLQQALEKLENYLDNNNIKKVPENIINLTPEPTAEILDQLIDQVNNIMGLTFTLRSYINAFISTDSYNAEAKKEFSIWEQTYVRMQNAITKIRAWVGSLGDLLQKAMSFSEETRNHSFALMEIAEQSQYMMSLAEEELAAELGLSGAGAWGKLQGTVTSQLSVEFEVDGEVKNLPMPALINLHNHPEEDTRRRAYEAEIAAWETIKEPIAAAMNGVKGYVNTLNHRRGREDSLHGALDQARIDRETLDSMLRAMKDSFPTFRKYFNSKAGRLGKEKLAWWDIFAPVGKTETKFTFSEAENFVVEQFSTFSNELAEFAVRAFNNKWVDAEMRDGKRGGAFCMYLPNIKESRILCNFDGSLGSVFTLAHELGHGYHNYCKQDKTMLQQSTPMTLAETASIMCETIVFDAVMKTTSNPEEELAILETSLIGDSQVIVDIYSRYLFETEVFERREKNELTAEEMCDIMEKAQEATYGDSLDADYRHKYMWVWKPHYYRPGLSFYNFPYAFGLLFGIGLYAIYQESGAGFIADYKNLLASTGEMNTADLAASFGIDIRDSHFWNQSLEVITDRINRYIKI